MDGGGIRISADQHYEGIGLWSNFIIITIKGMGGVQFPERSIIFIYLFNKLINKFDLDSLGAIQTDSSVT